MKKPLDPFKNLKLDPYEQEIEDALEPGEFRTIPKVEAEKKRIINIFREAARKDRRVNIRMNKRDLDKIQEKATENRLPYQTLISTILHHFAMGKIKIEL